MRTLCITLSFWLAASAAFAATRYPVIVSVSGKVEWTDKDGKKQAPKKGQVLMEKSHLKTGDKSEVILDLKAQRQLRLLPESELDLPAISWDTGEVPAVVLKQGSVLWKEGEKGPPGTLRSDLFEKQVPPGLFLWSFNPKTAIASVKAFEGQVEFSALHADEVALVTAGQKVQFIGVIEGSEIVYDILLKGVRIPRGKLGLVQPLSAEEKKAYSPTEVRKAQLLRQKKEAEELQARQPKRTTEDICEKPFGKLNDCAWSCENNPPKAKDCELAKPEVHCLRRRCNANGEWAEVTEVPKDRAACTLKVEVRSCDY